ncbi:hypothetical protein DERF_006196 [Dermatophagoides farinae]|uniref:Uncharacterized protein n=1 Tax=Dermatophagoides farinae TaxID=6954 RepID=A0A922I9V7_DERFA|nr:hypothetical protein DERF_006196 [Dermatophagoides farinae]
MIHNDMSERHLWERLPSPLLLFSSSSLDFVEQYGVLNANTNEFVSRCDNRRISVLIHPSG